MMISQMLKEKRQEYQLTQEQLAEKIFVSSKTISNWENDKTKPDIESLILLAKLFDLSLDNLLLEGSSMVKSINKDIKKGRNLKKIILAATLPLLAIILTLSWINYKEKNMTIVPLEDISRIELNTQTLTDTTKIEAVIDLDEKLKQSHLSSKDLDKIVVTYLDTKQLNGFDTNDLTHVFPQKVIWKR